MPCYRCLSYFKSHVLGNVAGTATHAYLEPDGAFDMYIYHGNKSSHMRTAWSMLYRWLLLLLFKFYSNYARKLFLSSVLAATEQ